MNLSRLLCLASIVAITFVVLIAAAAADVWATKQGPHGRTLAADISAASSANAASNASALGFTATTTTPAASLSGSAGSVTGDHVVPAAVARNAPSIWRAEDLAAIYTPTYTLLGCYSDVASLYAPRRLARRLAVSPVMTVLECARRAVAFNYPYFAITWFEDDPKQGYACWGAHDLALATSGGLAKDNRGRPVCGVECRRGNPPNCGKAYTYNLYQITSPALVGGDKGLDGLQPVWTLVAELPLAGAHLQQITGKDEYLVVDFMQGSHPSSWNGAYSVLNWARNNNTWRGVDYISNRLHLGCGWWMRQSDGEIVGFSGHNSAGIFGNAVADVRVFQRHRGDMVQSRPLPWGRWYGASVVLPDGRLYVVGGQGRVGGNSKSQSPKGAEIWDQATRTFLGRENIRSGQTGAFPVNRALNDASWVSAGYYPLLVVMPDGSVLFAQCKELQTINYLTGTTIGQAPTLPIQTSWEYPMSAPVTLLQMLPYVPGQPWTVDFVAFGGGWVSKWNVAAKDFAVRIRLTLDGSSPPKHTFSAWTVETMPGPRVQHDAILLPNGKVVILNGNEMGLGELSLGTSNYHVNEAWIYDPDAPLGQRFKRTASYTNIYRGYHNTALLSSQGDIIVSGSSVVRNFRSYTQRPYNITPYTNSEYRVEVFTPPYIVGNRPAWGAMPIPTFITYGSTFQVMVAGGYTAADIRSVVLLDPGGVTHSGILGYRNQILPSTTTTGTADTLTVAAPLNTFDAPPCFYLLFLVANDNSYSTGRWVQLRGPWGEPPITLRTRSTAAVPQATSQFEDGVDAVPFEVAAGSEATSELTAAAAGSSGNGWRVYPTSATVTLVTRAAFTVPQGARIHTHLWARTTAAGAMVSVDIGSISGSKVPTASWGAVPISGSVGLQYELFNLGGLIPGEGSFRLLITLSGVTPGTPVDLDDIETWMIGGSAAAAPVRPTSALRATAAAASASNAPRSDPARPSYFGDPSVTPPGDPNFRYAPALQGLPTLAYITQHHAGGDA